MCETDSYKIKMNTHVRNIFINIKILNLFFFFKFSKKKIMMTVRVWYRIGTQKEIQFLNSIF